MALTKADLENIKTLLGEVTIKGADSMHMLSLFMKIEKHIAELTRTDDVPAEKTPQDEVVTEKEPQ